MKNLKQIMAVTGTAFLIALGSQTATAQEQRPGRGNFDPEQFRQRMMDGYRERLEVKDDAAWKLIQERIDKVMAARRETGGMGGGFGGGFGRRGGTNSTDQAGDNGGRRNRGGPGGEPSPEAAALQKAIESKASPDEVKTKLAKLREARKDKEAELEKAQAELRKVLSVRQEAVAVLAGLLK